MCHPQNVCRGLEKKLRTTDLLRPYDERNASEEGPDMKPNIELFVNTIVFAAID
jgi:hypothetical protein